MVMISDGEDIAVGEAAAAADTSERCLFYDPALGGVPGCAALEYMAQTMALAVGCRARRAGVAPKRGYVLGSRRLEITLPVFRRDGKYRVHAKCAYTDEEFASFDCTISEAGGDIVASAALTAFQPSDNETPERKENPK